MSNSPPFLELEPYHVSLAEAKRMVIKVLSEEGISKPNIGWERMSLALTPTNQITFMKMVDEVRKSGVVPVIQRNIDRTDEIFGATFGMSIPTAMGPVTSTYAGHTKTMVSPMTNNPVEFDLSNDIMFYREESCLYSDEYDFSFCTRYYRAYLTSCVAIVDAFINRHLLIYKHRGDNSPDLELIQRTSRLEDRLDLFLKISAGRDITAINGGAEWIHFKKIRQLRNEITHINGPSLGYSIEDLAGHFNYVRKGIGGLLYLIRTLQGKRSLSFIEHLKTAPFVYFNHIRHKADGNHIIKRKK